MPPPPLRGKMSKHCQQLAAKSIKANETYMLALALLLLPLFAIESNRFFTDGMRVDPKRIAARMRIEKKWEDGGTEDADMRGRSRRQLIGGSPKEETIQVTAPLFSSRLFEYGPKVGDKELSGGIDMAKWMHLSRPITFFGHSHTTIWVLSNGGIAFDNGMKQYRPNILPSMGQKLIAPFWNRNDLRNGGKVMYREVNGGRVLERGQSEIRYQYDREVKVLSAVVVTYEKMQPVGSTPLPDENTNSFQVVLFLTSNGTFANFVYSNIGWTQGAEAGFNAGDGTNHFSLPTSGTGNIMYLEEYGNTGIPGEWMFILEEDRVVRCKAGIKGDTCDEACSPGEWGEDCGKCCHCAFGTCHEVSGECKAGGCARCWRGRDCQKRDKSCDSPRKCGQNAQPKVMASKALVSRCGEPTQSQCECLAGYEGNAEENCTDVNECAQKNSCHEKAICTNTPGRFFCQCPEGYSGNGITECVLSFLYPFEQSHRLPKDRNGRIEWQLKHPLKIFGQERDSVVITTNGLILVQGAKQLSTITSGEQPRLDELDVHGIAPFYAPIDLAQQGQIFVEQTTDPALLAKAGRTVNQQLVDSRQSPFEASHALMVTYVNVSLANTEAKFSNTFQTLLIGGREKQKHEDMTFVQFLYRDIAWSEGAEAGIMAPDKSSSILLPGSGTVGIEQLSQLSNVRSQGIWLFRVDLPSLLPCMQPDLQPPYCDARSPTLVNRLPPFHSTTPTATTTAQQMSQKRAEMAKEEGMEPSKTEAKKGKGKTTTAEKEGEISKEEREEEERETVNGEKTETNAERKQKSEEKNGTGKEQRQKILPQFEHVEQTEWQPVREEEGKKETVDDRQPQGGEEERGKEKEEKEGEEEISGKKEGEGERRGKEEREEERRGKEKEEEEGEDERGRKEKEKGERRGKEKEEEEGEEERRGEKKEEGEKRGKKTEKEKKQQQKQTPQIPAQNKTNGNISWHHNHSFETSISRGSSSRKPAIVTIQSKEIEEMPPDAFDDGNIRTTSTPRARMMVELEREIAGSIVPELIVPELVIGGKGGKVKGGGKEKEQKGDENGEENGRKTLTSSFLQEKSDDINSNNKGINAKPKSELRIVPISTMARTNAKEQPTGISPPTEEERAEGREVEQKQQQTEPTPKPQEVPSSSAVPPSPPPQRQRPTTAEAKTTARPTTTTTTKTTTEKETEEPSTEGTTAEVSRVFILITTNSTKHPTLASTKRTKATTAMPKVKPNDADGDEPMLMEFDNSNNNILAESAVHGNKLSVVVPVAIVLIWLVVLVVVAVFLCCRRRQTQERLRTLYGPAYQIRPVYTMRVNKLGSGNGSYEEHLDKAAHRLSAEMAYNQNPFVPGRYSLYGSYWNISPQGSGVSRRNGGTATLNGIGPHLSQHPSRAQMAPLEISSPRGSSGGDGSGGSSAFGTYIQSLAKMRAANGVGGTERDDAQSEYFANSQRNATRSNGNNNGAGRI